MLQLFRVRRWGQGTARAGRGSTAGTCHQPDISEPPSSPRAGAPQPARRADWRWRGVIKLGASPAPTGSRQVLGTSWSGRLQEGGVLPPGSFHPHFGSDPAVSPFLAPGLGVCITPLPAPSSKPHCSLGSPTAAACLPPPSPAAVQWLADAIPPQKQGQILPGR